MIDLYAFLVEQAFGSFWIAVVVVAFIFLIILALGGTSGTSIGFILMSFFLLMALGYGYLWLSVPIIIGIIYFSVTQLLSDA